MKKEMLNIPSAFNFSEEDCEHLVHIETVMAEYAQKTAETFLKHLHINSDDKNFAKEKKKCIAWYRALFSGKYDDKYFQQVKLFASGYAKMGINGCLVDAGISRLRTFLLEAIEKHYSDSPDKPGFSLSVSKILDINLSLMAEAYQETELKKAFLSHRLESFLVNIAERFNYGLNLILVAALMGISIGVVGVFFKDILHVVESGDMGHGLISAMGSLIIIWVMIELMETEIEHLKGKAFPIIVFIHIVLVSFLREVLVVSLQHDINKQMLMAGTALVLGLIYWLVAKAEKPTLE